MVRIPTLPPLIFIKALIFRGFFVPMCFWSPIWSPTFCSASSGLQWILMDTLFSWNDSRQEGGHCLSGRARKRFDQT